MLNWILTLGAVAACAGLGLFANWKAGRPYDDARPNVIPWRLVMIFAVFGLVLAVTRTINLFGFETGPEHGLFGRF